MFSARVPILDYAEKPMLYWHSSGDIREREFFLNIQRNGIGGILDLKVKVPPTFYLLLNITKEKQHCEALQCSDMRNTTIEWAASLRIAEIDFYEF